MSEGMQWGINRRGVFFITFEKGSPWWFLSLRIVGFDLWMRTVIDPGDGLSCKGLTADQSCGYLSSF